MELSESEMNKKRFTPSRAHVAIIVLALVLPFTVLLYKNETSNQSKAAGVAYFVDCLSGNDTNSGTSEVSAWKTLAKANTAVLAPGEQLLLKRDCTWTNDQLKAKWVGTAAQQIIIGSYGTGALPIIKSTQSGLYNVNITGSYQVIDGIVAQGVAPRTEAACGNNGVGELIGFYLDQTASYNTLQNSQATGLATAVSGRPGSNHNKILHNQFTNNTVMVVLNTSNNNDDYGAYGVEMQGDDNEIAYNTISGNDACSYDYGRDGSAVEIYRGQRNSIHHNRSDNNNTFSELGEARSADNVFAYNVATASIPSALFLVTRGAGDVFGPVARTVVYNNVAYFTSTTSGGGAAVVCYAGCSPSILAFKNNIIWSNGGGGVVYADAPFNESNNIYWKTGGNPQVYFTMDSTSKKVDPQFVNPLGFDFHLNATSPAIDTGTMASVTAGYALDFDNKTVPVGAGVDIGVYEYGATGGTSPTVAPTVNPSVTPVPTSLSTTTPAPTSTPIPTAIPTPVPTSTGVNLLKNPSFENGLTSWYSTNRVSATATITTGTKVNGAYSAQVNVKKSSSNAWYVQLSQDLPALIVGKTYTVSFWAKASKNLSIQNVIQQSGGNWTVYSDKSFNANTAWQKFTYTYTGQTTNPLLFTFNLAKTTGIIWIDTVSIQ